MVSNYPLERCKYLTGRLKPFIYLLPKETTQIDYNVDTKQRKPYPSFCEVSSIQYTNCIKLEGFLTTLNVTESSDNRLDFSSSVSLSMLEQWNNTWVSLLEELKLMNCYVIVEDVEGTQYIQTPEFPSYFTYTYDFGNEGNGNVAQIRYTCDCNFPLVYVRNNVTATTTYKGNCNYIIGGAKNLKMTPYQYAYAINDVNTGNFSTITCTGGEVMHDVEFLKGSFSFRQEYNGRNYNERLVFKIPLSKYKYIFRYNLVEFNLNRYAITFETNEGNWIAAGFEFGFQPTYTVETSDTEEDLNTIEITLHHSGQNSILWCEGTPEIVDSHTELYVPIGAYIKDEETSEMLLTLHCVNKTYAINTLAEMVTESGVRTGKYLCLNDPEYGDWREYYRHFNIVGTYDSNSDLGFELTTSSSLCAALDNCDFIKMTKEVYSFSKAGSYYDTFVENPCPWDLKAVPNWINVTMYDEEDGRKRVRFTSRENPTDQRKIDLGYVQSFDNTSTVQFILEKKADWINPAEFEITAKKQTLTSYVDVPYDEYEICSIPEGLTAEKVDGTSMLKINVPQNDEETGTRTFEVELCRNDGERGTITIHQDHLYVEWREDVGNFICVDGTSYRKIDKWIGYDIGHIDILTEESVAGRKLVDADPRCENIDIVEQYDEKWEMTEETICIETDLYGMEQKWESFDGGVNWSPTEEFRQTEEPIEEDSEQCQELPEMKYKYIVDRTRYECDNETHTSYFLECKWWSYDEEVWLKVEPEECQISTEIRQENDTACGYVPGYNERWQLSSSTYCNNNNGHLYYLERKYISADGGLTWLSTDEYRESMVDSGNPCEGDDIVTEWIIDYHSYLCDGYDSYYIEKQYYHYLSRPDEKILVIPVQIQRSNEIREDNDPVCGYVDPRIYRWFTDTGETVCLNGNKYEREDYKYSDDNGETWTYLWSRTGELIEESSEECEGTPQRYRWVEDQERYICDGVKSYFLEYRQETRDNVVWVNSEPEVTQRGRLRLANDPDCGGGQTIYQWVEDGTTICEYAEEPQETERWIDVTGEYICDGYNKYQKQKKQTYSNGDWIDTTETRAGSLIQNDSVDCGYVEETEEWRTIDNTFICLDGNKYLAVQRYYKVNGNWTTDGEIDKGMLIETNSTDCDSSEQGIMYEYTICGTENWDCINGYRVYPTTKKVNTDGTGFVWMTIGEECSFTSRGVYPTSCENEGVTLYRWTDTPSTICDCGNEYQKQIQEVSMDDGTTWTPNGVERKGQLIQEQSENCESDRMERWVNVTGDYICEGTDKYQKQRLEYSYDGGDTWIAQTDTRKGELIQSDSTDCGYVEEYRWVNNGTTCVGYDKYNMMKQQIKRDGVWTDTGLTQRGSLIESNSSDCGYVPPSPGVGDYLTFTALEDGRFKCKYKEMRYSLDEGATWNLLYMNNETPIVKAGSKILWKQTGKSPNTNYGIGNFYSTGRFNVSGNIMSLYYGDDFVGKTNLSGKSYAFKGLFSGCSYLVDASKLILPATTLASYCYEDMFYYCTSLVNAPALPATTLAYYCYHHMFDYCSALTTAPQLPATTLANYCYSYMFCGCTSLVNAPVLPATTLTEYCYEFMFSSCTSLTAAPALTATTLSFRCYYGMFNKCTSLTSAPALSATTLAVACYQYMFTYCTSLVNAPALPATTLAKECYEEMFKYCSALTTAPQLPATVTADYCYQYMFYGCTSLTSAPVLPATTLSNYCYRGMFIGCTSLRTAPSVLPSTTMYNYCYQGMFEDCTSLTTAPELPATILVVGCYQYMFRNCGNLNYIKAMFTTTPKYTYTEDWVKGVAASGTFVKNVNATWTTYELNGGIPSGWTVVLSDE